VALATASGVTLITLFTTGFFGVRLGPYAGIVGFLALPTVLILGLILIAVGATRKGVLPPTEGLRETAFFIGVMTAVNLVLLLTASYRGLHDMDTPQFCGQSCHVMNPQFAAYEESIHARIACVECHIAPGAGGLIDAKLAGSRQLLMYLAGRYTGPSMATPRITAATAEIHHPAAPRSSSARPILPQMRRTLRTPQ
jgi:hypothetical protein